jgi:hypothetical protein
MGDGQSIPEYTVTDLTELHAPAVRRFCESDKHVGAEIPAQRQCVGESWQDQTLYFCNGCAKDHTSSTHHRTEPIDAKAVR